MADSSYTNYVSHISKAMGYKWLGPGLSAGQLRTPSNPIPYVRLSGYLQPTKPQAPINFLDAAARLHDIRYSVARVIATNGQYRQYLNELSQIPGSANSVYLNEARANMMPSDIGKHLVYCADKELMANCSRSRKLSGYKGYFTSAVVQGIFAIRSKFGLYSAPTAVGDVQVTRLTGSELGLLLDQYPRGSNNIMSTSEAIAVSQWLEHRLAIDTQIDSRTIPINKRNPTYGNRHFRRNAYPPYAGAPDLYDFYHRYNAYSL